MDANARKRKRCSYKEDATVQKHKFYAPQTPHYLQQMYDATMEKPGNIEELLEMEGQRLRLQKILKRLTRAMLISSCRN
jgi:hypothetical protein